MKKSLPPGATPRRMSRERIRLIGNISLVAWAIAMFAMWVTPTVYNASSFGYSAMACRPLFGLPFIADAGGSLNNASSVDWSLTESWLESSGDSPDRWTAESDAVEASAACDVARENRGAALVAVGIGGLAGIVLTRRRPPE